MKKIIFIIFFIMMGALEASSASKERLHLLFPLRTLFSHRDHLKTLEELNMSCSDCHNFSIKSEKAGPLGRPVKENFLKPPLQVCHQCHLGKVSFARPNQCKLCHINAQILRPKDHLVSWRQQHGKMAQMDRDACARCHTPQSCDQCHAKVDTMNPQVHRANFRLQHSVEARFNPQSCVACHKKSSFCVDCHFGKRQ